ncbi:MAG: DUF4838 domain-containing protein [Clostridia bacterium]|nr:DUF4838 domain-containing protein [Clostridia bacterium]
MKKEKRLTASLLIHPEELDRAWIDRCVSLGIPTLALHPVGGKRAALMMKNMLERLETEEFRALLDEATEKGLQIEYEMHAARYFLPFYEFEKHPEWFRMDENGKRTPDMNFCVSNEEAMDYVVKRATQTAKRLYRSSHRYFFWLDDAHDAFCHCPECSKYSSSDQQMLVMNRMLAELRRDDPEATLAYLAYYSTLTPPEKVQPAEGIFLEYAPIDRDHHRPMSDKTSEKNNSQNHHIEALIEKFGKDGAKVLDYWLDNSLFSDWKKPPKPFAPDIPVIHADFDYYHALGFDDLSCFACYLGEDYRELHGEPDVKPFADAYHTLCEEDAE